MKKPAKNTAMSGEEFAKKVLETEPSLYRVARSILKNDADCADAMQDAILSAYERLDTLKEERYFKTWITRILINECYDLLRSLDRHAAVSYDDYAENLMPAGTRTEQADFSELYYELERLDDEYRLPLMLHYIGGYSTKEIAQIAGVSDGSIRVRLHRGRKLLKEKLI